MSREELPWDSSVESWHVSKKSRKLIVSASVSMQAEDIGEGTADWEDMGILHWTAEYLQLQSGTAQEN